MSETGSEMPSPVEGILNDAVERINDLYDLQEPLQRNSVREINSCDAEGNMTHAWN